VLSNALVVASVSGACFNPAVGVLALLHGKYENMWVSSLPPPAFARLK
jgi:glycerol uptake facilitator-like aquaporin